MKIIAKIKRGAAVCAAAAVIAVAAGGGAVYGASYSDVPANHSAYTQIERVSAAGIMVGDASGKFNPNDGVDKFEAAKVLAIIAGYKYTGRTSAEQSSYDAAYNKWKSLISQYVAKFKKWNSTTDREVAFLLEKGVFVAADLNQFVIVDTAGAEKIRVTTKQDAAVFLTKVIGKGPDALKAKYTETFADASKISATAKPYVYYLKGIGVFTGDDKNNFNPASNMSRASMAIVVARALDAVSPGRLPASSAQSPASSAAPSQPSAQPAASPAPPQGADAAPIQTYSPVSGTITKIYDSFSAIQITGIDPNGSTKIYAVATNAIIKVDGYTKAFKDLREGMTVTCALSGAELVTVNAVSNGAPPAASASPVGAQPPADSQAPAAPSSAAANDRSVIEGTVSSVRSDASGNFISIEVRILTPRNTVITETRTFTVPASAPITRGGASAAFSTIVKGDIVSAEVSGATAYSVELQEKNRSFTAILTQKRYIEETGAAILTFKEQSGKTSDLRVAGDSSLNRRGVGICAYTEFRVGDSVDIKTEYDKIVEGYAYGTRSTVDAVVTDISVSKTDGSRVTVLLPDGAAAVYPVITEMFDVYALRVGSKYRISLDSAEAELFTAIENNVASVYTGVITSIANGRVYIKDVAVGNINRDFSYDGNTVFKDLLTGKTITSAGLAVNQRVTVTVGSNIALAKTVVIVAK